MNDKLIQSQQRLRESLYDLYEIGGLELMKAGTRGLKCNLTTAPNHKTQSAAAVGRDDKDCTF